MLRIILFIGIGGGLGSIGRYLTSVFFLKLFPVVFPVGTFIVNVAGCILMGLLFGISLKQGWLSAEWRFFLMSGFCGGFTTFSAFAFENFTFIQNGQYSMVAWYMGLTLLLTVVGVFVGFGVSRVLGG